MFREYNEFFSTIFKTSSDNRNLLLDYNVLYKPLKKNFPTIGFEEIYYNFSNGFIEYTKLNSIEL
jgi:NADH:ubiquinone oxidoreductase subunit C